MKQRHRGLVGLFIFTILASIALGNIQGVPLRGSIISGIVAYVFTGCLILLFIWIDGGVSAVLDTLRELF